ncbi:MAG TPA: lysylphosphatidylglycerol synthase transmembrane domain-containing protein [Stellaceae bacterium]|nr:lysylphosphatidylglycerol synthase transmembrane domain-containing protein [Stellaceae bacterium]
MSQASKSPGIRLLLSGVRVAVTVGLLAVLVAKVDRASLGAVLAQARPAPFALAVVALAAATLVNAWRWDAIMGKDTSPGWVTLLKLLWLGLFFNQVLPSGVGGDAVRAWRCRGLGMSLGTAVRSILLDRACGYSVLVLLYAGGLPFLLPHFAGALQRATLIGLFALASLGLVALFLIDRLPRFLAGLRLLWPLTELSREARRVFFHRRSIYLLGLAAIGVGLSIYSSQVAAQSVGVRLAFVDWVVVLPPVIFIQLVPVSLAGWGVREVALVVILAVFGVPAVPALAASLAIGLSQIVVGLPGGLVWIGNWDRAGAALPLPAAPPDIPRGPGAGAPRA